MTASACQPLSIAAAQSVSVDGDVECNLLTHLAFMEEAAARGVQTLVFPELSLTGYGAQAMAGQRFGATHPALERLQQGARAHGLTVVVGAPADAVAPASLPAIGAWSLDPEGRVQLYRKRHLHGGEADFASAGEQRACVLNLSGEPTGLAVCADATHPEHALAARTAGARLYAAGSLISEAGYGPESQQLAGYSRELGMAVLLANHGGPTGGYVSAGRSAFWAPGGAPVVVAPGAGDWLVVARRSAGGAWSGEAVALGDAQ